MRSRDLPNQKKKYSELNGRLARYVSAVQSLYDDLCRGAANAVVIEEVGEGKFSFGDNKALERKIEDLQSQFVSEMQVMIHRGTSEEWRRSNEVQDMIADKVVGTYTRQKRVKLPTISLAKVGKENAELTDDYHDFCLPKGVRERIGEIEKIKTFNQIKAYFESKGIFLETDVKSLLGERGDEYIEAVASAGQNIIAAYESYIEVYGKDALKKLRGIRLKDDSCKSTASYHYNAIGEKDPLEGVICFRQFGSAGGHNVFHEFAHCYQDSQVRGGEDAVMAADRIMESIKEKPAGVRAYFGADKNAANAEAMAEGFAYAFKYGDKEYVDFLKSVQSYQSRESVRQSHRQYYLANGKQLEAFQNRRDRGLNLSDKLWKQSKDMRTAMEDAISCALEKGIDAVTLSKKLSQYLRDFDSMKADYKERFGSASNAKDCEYRSIRLARSEINMAYRKAEQERWQQFDFVLGYEIKLSGSHPAHDVCDHLAGKYPKDFVWTGWHPNDMCYVVPILMSEEEYFEEEEKQEESPRISKYEAIKEYTHQNGGIQAAIDKEGDDVKYRMPDILSDEEKKRNKEIVSVLDKSFDETSESVVLYQGISLFSADDIGELPLLTYSGKGSLEEMIGERYTDKYFVTATKRKSIADDYASIHEELEESVCVVQRIHVPKGGKVIDTTLQKYKDNGIYASDEDVILPRSSIFEVKRILGGENSNGTPTITIDLEWVGEEKKSTKQKSKSIVTSRKIEEVPPQFIDWCKENEGRIGESYAHGTAPYFVRDNSKYVLEAYGESSKIYKGILHKEALEISKAAKYVGGDLQELASGLASKYGGVVTDINYKSTQSIERKCATDRTNPSSLKDVVRTTIIVDEDKIESVLSELSENEMFVRLKRQRPEKFNGYSGNIVNMRMPRNGIQGEIQVNTAKMIYAKEPESVARKILGDKVWESISKETGLEGGLGHKYYEEIRVLDMLDPKQKEMRIQLEKKMREYYKKFR